LSSLTSYLSFLFKLCFKSWLDLCILLIHDLVLCNLWTFKIKVFVPNVWVRVFHWIEVKLTWTLVSFCFFHWGREAPDLVLHSSIGLFLLTKSY
jgi:hypothetical protein